VWRREGSEVWDTTRIESLLLLGFSRVTTGASNTTTIHSLGSLPSLLTSPAPANRWWVGGGWGGQVSSEKTNRRRRLETKKAETRRIYLHTTHFFPG